MTFTTKPLDFLDGEIRRIMANICLETSHYLFEANNDLPTSFEELNTAPMIKRLHEHNHAKRNNRHANLSITEQKVQFLIALQRVRVLIQEMRKIE